MIDASLLFSGSVSAANVVSGQAVTVTAASTNVLDMLAFRDIGGGFEVEVHVDVLVTFTGATSMQVVLQSSADNSAFVDILLSPVIVEANLIQGARIFKTKVPNFNLNDVGVPNRYYRLNYVVVGTHGAGSLIAYLTGGGDMENFVAYPNNY